MRHVPPTQPDLIRRKVREAHGRLYTNQIFVDQHGPFLTPEDVVDVAYICIGEEDEMIPFLLN